MVIRVFLAVLLLGAIVGCTRPPAAQRESPSATSDPSSPASAPSSTSERADTGPPGLTCTLQVSRSGDRHSMSLRLTNTGSAPVELRYYHPLSFALRAWMDGNSIPPRVPAIDMPVELRTVRVEPGGSVEVVTPIALSFGPGSRELDQSDPFRWWLDHEPGRVRLEASRAFKSDPRLLCTGVLVP